MKAGTSRTARTVRRRLRAGGRLDRYVGSLFAASYATAFLLVVGLFVVLDLASNIDDFLEPWDDGSKAPIAVLARYYLMNVPFLYLQVAPMVTLVAGMFTISKLHKNNEIVAAVGAGVSTQRIVAPVMLGAALVAGGMFALREWATATLGDRRDAHLDVLREHRLDRVYDVIWVRDVHGSHARIGELRPATGTPRHAEIRDLTVYLNTPSGGARIHADRAVWGRDASGAPAWVLENGTRKEVEGERPAEPVAVLEGFDLTPDLALTFHRGRESPLELSFSQARELASRDPDNVSYQTVIQYHLSFPLANLVLLLVGLPILMRQERGRGMEGIALGCLLCVFFLSADFVFRSMGLEGGVHPLMAGWVPLLLFGSLGAVLYDGMRA
jgi:lipopolysaccharide export LptBFGC system permease protein LptF